MRILFITNFYSGLKKSILNNKWQPQGMPAVYKIFEKLQDKGVLFDNVYFSNSNPTWVYENDYLKNKNYIFNTKKKYFLPHFLNELLKFKYILRFIDLYDIFYVDRANVMIGAMLTVIGKKVILRLHGVNSYYNEYDNFLKKIFNFFVVISYRSFFHSIICSEDGTPGNLFLKKYCNKNVRSYLMLNGVCDLEYNALINRKSLGINSNVTVITFLARLEEGKGVWEFIYTMEKLSKKELNFRALIIGDGPLIKLISKYISKTNIFNILIIGAINHLDVYSYLKISDIFVSLNKLGNLCNTTLEAIQSEKCIITLAKSKKLNRDFSTFQIFEDSAIYINREKIVEDLYIELKCLILNKKAIEFRVQKIKKIKSKLESWDTRIEKEVDLIFES